MIGQQLCEKWEPKASTVKPKNEVNPAKINTIITQHR